MRIRFHRASNPSNATRTRILTRLCLPTRLCEPDLATYSPNFKPVLVYPMPHDLLATPARMLGPSDAPATTPGSTLTVRDVDAPPSSTRAALEALRAAPAQKGKGTFGATCARGENESPRRARKVSFRARRSSRSGCFERCRPGEFREFAAAAASPRRARDVSFGTGVAPVEGASRRSWSALEVWRASERVAGRRGRGVAATSPGGVGSRDDATRRRLECDDRRRDPQARSSAKSRASRASAAALYRRRRRCASSSRRRPPPRRDRRSSPRDV